MLYSQKYYVKHIWYVREYKKQQSFVKKPFMSRNKKCFGSHFLQKTVSHMTKELISKEKSIVLSYPRKIANIFSYHLANLGKHFCYSCIKTN